MTTRRGFLAGAATLLAAPMVVRSGILMPVRSIIPPPPPIVPSWCPPGWLPCDGRAVSASAFPDLFALLDKTPQLMNSLGAAMPPPVRARNILLHPIIRAEDGGEGASPVGTTLFVLGN